LRGLHDSPKLRKPDSLNWRFAVNPNEERDRLHAERRKALYEADYSPGYTPTNMPGADIRLANAADYAAYQLGQMNRNLARLVDLLEKRGQ
jgi:hypothetical protein